MALQTPTLPFSLLLALPLWGCSSPEQERCINPDTQAAGTGQFDSCVMPESMQSGGYIDSTFINKSGDRIYFLHSPFSPSVLDGSSTPDKCSHAEADMLPGHTTTPGLEWNTDLYYVEWSGVQWSEPINIGAPINSLGMECCVWLNDDETEIIYNTTSDLDGDGEDGDLGAPPTGNYRATRADRDAPWGEPVALPGEYGTEGQGEVAVWRNDVEKVPSGNLYLWERTLAGENLLVFGERIGGTDEEPTYAPPVNIAGTTHSETQVWVNETETRLVYNHREDSGQTELHTRSRASTEDAWGESSVVSTVGFADSKGNDIWGEPSFDHSEEFLLMTRFDTSDADCWTPDLIVSWGDVENGYENVSVLN